MASGFFSRIIADARRSLPATTTTRKGEQGSSVEASMNIQASTANTENTGMRHDAFSAGSKFQPVMDAQQPPGKRYLDPTSSPDQSQPVATTSMPAGPLHQPEYRKAKQVQARGESGLSKQHRTAPRQQKLLVPLNEQRPPLTQAGAEKKLLPAVKSTAETSAKPAFVSAGGVVQPGSAHVNIPVQSFADVGEQAGLNSNRQRRIKEKPANPVSAQGENSNPQYPAAAAAAAVLAGSESHAAKEIIPPPVKFAQEIDATALHQLPSIGSSDAAQSLRAPAPAQTRPAPHVHIGHVDVMVIADKKESVKQHVPASANNFSSRNYLRRL